MQPRHNLRRSSTASNPIRERLSNPAELAHRTGGSYAVRDLSYNRNLIAITRAYPLRVGASVPEVFALFLSRITASAPRFAASFTAYSTPPDLSPRAPRAFSTSIQPKIRYGRSGGP